MLPVLLNFTDLLVVLDFLILSVKSLLHSKLSWSLYVPTFFEIEALLHYFLVSI